MESTQPTASEQKGVKAGYQKQAGERPRRSRPLQRVLVPSWGLHPSLCLGAGRFNPPFPVLVVVEKDTALFIPLGAVKGLWPEPLPQKLNEGFIPPLHSFISSSNSNPRR